MGLLMVQPWVIVLVPVKAPLKGRYSVRKMDSQLVEASDGLTEATLDCQWEIK